MRSLKLLVSVSVLALFVSACIVTYDKCEPGQFINYWGECEDRDRGGDRDDRDARSEPAPEPAPSPAPTPKPEVIPQ